MPTCITYDTNDDKVIVNAAIEIYGAFPKVAKRWVVLKPEQFAIKYTYVAYDELYILPDELQQLHPQFISMKLFHKIWQRIELNRTKPN